MKIIIALLATCGLLFGAPPSPAANDPVGPVISTNARIGMPSGPRVFGIFNGRTPCQELSRQLNVSASDECNKMKCRLILYQDPVTHSPTVYDWQGKIRWTGKWSITTGTKADPDAMVYRLEPQDARGFLSFLKVDDNILFFLNQNGEPLVGNLEFSYTLNRSPQK